MTGNGILGWDHAQDCIDSYKTAISNPDRAVAGYLNNTRSFSTIGVNCAPTRKEAMNEQGEAR